MVQTINIIIYMYLHICFLSRIQSTPTHPIFFHIDKARATLLEVRICINICVAWHDLTSCISQLMLITLLPQQVELGNRLFLYNSVSHRLNSRSDQRKASYGTENSMSEVTQQIYHHSHRKARKHFLSTIS